MSKVKHEMSTENSVLLAFYDGTRRNINILHKAVFQGSFGPASLAGCSLVSSLFTIYRWSDVVSGHS